MSVVRRAAAAFVNVAVIVVVLAAPPWALLHFAGNPLPGAVDQIGHLSVEPVTLQRLAPFLTILLWMVWLLLVASVAIEAVYRIKGITPARWLVLRPVQGLAAALVAGQAATVLAPATAALAPASYVDPPGNTVVSAAPLTQPPVPPMPAPPVAHDVAGVSAASNAAAGTTPAAAAFSNVHAGMVQGPATILVGGTSYIYVVKRGDWMSKIAKAWLGDADRWPEICELNRHRHFGKVGGALHDCNLIYPGWDLRLPADARPPTDANPMQPTQPPAPPLPPLPPPAQDPDGVVGAPTSSPSAAVNPSATVSAQATTSPSAAANPAVPIAPTTSAAASASPTGTALAKASVDASADASMTAPDGQGVRLPDGSWLTWSLAVAISAAAAMVWLQRRRRFTIKADNDDLPTELAPPVVQLRRALAYRPELTLHPGKAEQAAKVPELAALPPGGIGLHGQGAHAAARAALVAALASGGPHDPDARGEVVIAATTLTTLIGSDAVTLGPWPRLHIADDIDHALTVIETQLLHRSRILDEHCLSDLDTLRAQAPDEEALPPILLVADSPPPAARMRTKVSLALGTGLHLSAILLGQWAHGATVEVTTDGHTKLTSGQPTEAVPPRLPVLTAEATIDILNTLHEAHTGQPSAARPSATRSSAAPIALVASRAAEPIPEPTPAWELDHPASAAVLPSGATAGRKARLRVLGTPRIEDITAPGRDLRSKARELAVFLACHPDGASTREIGEFLEPDARLSQADQRVHTNASNLRHVLARAGSADAKNTYVIKTAGRYRLDPATVDVDLWQLRDLLRNGGIATGDRRRTLLTQACDLYGAPLADGTDYEWITAHRETVRRWGTEAHLLLADDLLDTDPQAASHLLDKAIGLDRYNEALYRKAMHARHAIGDPDGIRTLLRALTKALADLDAEPEEDTTALATTLRISLPRR